eukprot:11218888-Alexandrium_andersonii.AAC.1
MCIRDRVGTVSLEPALLQVGRPLSHHAHWSAVRADFGHGQHLCLVTAYQRHGHDGSLPCGRVHSTVL